MNLFSQTPSDLLRIHLFFSFHSSYRVYYFAFTSPCIAGSSNRGKYENNDSMATSVEPTHHTTMSMDSKPPSTTYEKIGDAQSLSWLQMIGGGSQDWLKPGTSQRCSYWHHVEEMAILLEDCTTRRRWGWQYDAPRQTDPWTDIKTVWMLQE